MLIVPSLGAARLAAREMFNQLTGNYHDSYFIIKQRRAEGEAALVAGITNCQNI